MKIFLSWSGAQSRKLAEALDWWLPNMFQSVETFISSTDIEAGEKWHGRLSKVLEDYDFGIACLTSPNITAPWILFESGALAKKDKSRLIPLLCDMREHELKDSPLTLFNYKHLSKDGMRDIAKSINNYLGSEGLKDKNLDETFDIWWNRFQEKMEEVIKAKDGLPTKKFDIESSIEEMLSLLRSMARHLDRAPAVRLDTGYQPQNDERGPGGFRLGALRELFGDNKPRPSKRTLTRTAKKATRDG